MFRVDRQWWIVIAAAAIAGTVALAQEQDREREWAQLREMLAADAGLTQEELSLMEPELIGRTWQQQERDQLREMLKTGIESGCRGECLAAMVRAMNQARHQGATAMEARRMCCRSLELAIQERERMRSEWGDRELGNQVQRQAQMMLVNMEQVRQRERSGPEGGGVPRTETGRGGPSRGNNSGNGDGGGRQER